MASLSLVNCVLHPAALDAPRVYSIYTKSISRDCERFVICVSSLEGNLVWSLKSLKLIEPCPFDLMISFLESIPSK